MSDKNQFLKHVTKSWNQQMLRCVFKHAFFDTRLRKNGACVLRVRRPLISDLYCISFHSRDLQVFKTFKLAQCATSFWLSVTKKDISANLYQKCLILCSKILLNVLHNMNLTVWLPWQHTGFQTSPILKAIMATSGIPFWYLQMVPHVLDPARWSI